MGTRIGSRTRFLMAAFALAFSLFAIAPQIASAQTTGFDGYKVSLDGTKRGEVVDGYVKFGSGWYWKVYAKIKDTKSDERFVRLYYKLDRPGIVSDTGWIQLVQAGTLSGHTMSDSDVGYDPTNGIWVKICVEKGTSVTCATKKYIKNE